MADKEDHDEDHDEDNKTIKQKGSFKKISMKFSTLFHRGGEKKEKTNSDNPKRVRQRSFSGPLPDANFERDKPIVHEKKKHDSAELKRGEDSQEPEEHHKAVKKDSSKRFTVTPRGSGINKNDDDNEIRKTLSLPDSEQIISTFTCRCNGKQGRLVVTPTAFIFYHNLFGFTKYVIELKTVLYMAKRTTSNFLFNDSFSVEIQTFKEQYSLSNFAYSHGVERQRSIEKDIDPNDSNKVKSREKDRENAFSVLQEVYKPFSDNSSLSAAIKKNKVEHIKALLELDNTELYNMEELDDDGEAPIHRACMVGNPDVIRIFLDYYKAHNLNINIPDRSGWTVMHIAVYYCTGKDSEETVLRMLLDYPTINVEVDNNDSNTPLHYFCEKFVLPSCSKIGQDMIKKGAVVNRKNRYGETPIHKAMFNRAVRVLMVKLLIANGADVNIPNDKFGETALHYAVHLERKDIMKILIDAGADVTIKSRQGQTPYDLAVAAKSPKIEATLKRVIDLIKWLRDVEMEDLLKKFLKEDLYLDVLSGLDDDTMNKLIDTLEIKAAGKRLRLLKGMKALQGSFSHEEMQHKIKKGLPINKAPKLYPELKPEIISSINSTGWLIQATDLEYTEELGRGTSAKVYKGLFRGEKVAIKVLKKGDENVVQDFEKEFKIMSVTQNPHIIGFKGACLTPKICMVLEFASLGSLFHVLNKKDTVIGWDLAFKWMIEMSAGMNYLHTCQPPILHRDMKSLNILVTQDWAVKITDFGLSRTLTANNMQTFQKMVGTIGWTAPELMFGGEFTAKSDVYSGSMVLWEIIQRVIKSVYSKPYSEFPHLQMEPVLIITNSAENNLRPTIPPTCNPELAAVVHRAWAGQPEDRPTYQELLTELNGIHANYLANVEAWNSIIEAPPPSFEVPAETKSEKTADSY